MPGQPGRTQPSPLVASRFLEGPIAGTLVRFALPLLVTNLLHAAAGTWATAWVGQVLGPDALSAMATAAVLLFMLMGAAIGIGSASGVAISQSLGAGDRDAQRRVTGCAITMVAGLSVLLAAIGWWATPAIVAALDTPAEARAFAITHLRLTCLSMPPIFIHLVLAMILRGTGDARTPFRYTLVWIGLSVLLVPALLTGVGGLLPGMGIAGVGLANLLAATTALILLSLHVHRQHARAILRAANLPYLLPPARLLWLMTRRSLPVALEAVVTQGAYFVLLAQVNAYGVVAASAYSGAAQLWAYVQMPTYALATSMSAIAAMNIGAGHWRRVGQIARRGCLVSLAIAGSAALSLYLLGAWFDELPLRLFIPSAGPVLEKARDINVVVLWSWVALAITMSLSGIVRANGAMLPPTLIFIITMWLGRVPFALGLQPWLGEAAIWWSFPFGTVTSALLTYAYYRWGRWRERGLMLEQAAP